MATGVPGIEVAMRLHDRDMKLVRDWAAAPAAGVALTFEADLPNPGAYWLEVSDSYDDARSVEPITLTASLAAAEDGAEPNDRPRDAATLTLGAATPATILPKGDRDLFARDAAAAPLTVTARGVPKAIGVALRLLDANMDVVRDWVAPPADGVDTAMTVGSPWRAAISSRRATPTTTPARRTPSR